MNDASSAQSRGQELDAEREVLLREQPPSLGARWALDWRESLKREGRSVTGGWPGTLPEARARVMKHLDAELARRGLTRLSLNEIVSATRATYNRAKKDWLLAARSEKKSVGQQSSR